MPAVVGELLAGVLLGPSVLGAALPAVQRWLFPPAADQFHLLDAVGQVGVLLLVALTGMEVQPAMIRARGRDAAFVSAFGLVVPLAAGIGVGLMCSAALYGPAADRLTFALFLGVAMGVTAIPVIGKILSDMRLLHRPAGQIIMMAGMADDVLGWLLLSVISALVTTGVRPQEVMISVGFVIAVVLIVVGARPLAGFLLRASGNRMPQGQVPAVVTMVLAAATLSQAMRLEGVFGAFLVGIVLRWSGGLDDSALAPLRVVVNSVLAPIFLATAGLRIDLAALIRPAVLGAAVVIFVVAVLSKLGSVYLGARMSRNPPWDAFVIGAGMNTRGVIGIVVASVGHQLGILGPAAYAIVALVAVLTSMMTPPLLRLGVARMDRAARENDPAADRRPAAPASPGAAA
jgi:Kef-type K+ transport system membrane component KefB